MKLKPCFIKPIHFRGLGVRVSNLTAVIRIIKLITCKSTLIGLFIFLNSTSYKQALAPPNFMFGTTL